MLENEITLGAEYEDGILRGTFADQIFLFEWLYNTENGFTDSLIFSWPLAQDPRKRILINAEPDMWESDASRRMGNHPDRLGKYFAGLQYLDESLDLRFFHPLVYEVDSERIRPYAELRHLHLFDVNEIEIFCRGKTDFHTYSFSLGASKQISSFELKGFLNDFKDFSWSIGCSTVIN